MAQSYSISDLAREFDLTTRAIRFYEDMGRLGLSLTEAKDLIDMYDTPRDTLPQLRKFLVVLAEHRQQLEAQLADLQATLDEVKAHEKETRLLLTRPAR